LRVFISHSSKDRPAVEALAEALTERGLVVWLDKWEIGPGDDVVQSINAGLDEADAGIVVFSDHSRESRWVEAETSYLTYARIEEGKVLIPVLAEEGAWVPPLLRPLARRGVDEVEAIADGLRGRSAGPPPVERGEDGKVDKVLVSLRRDEDGGIEVRVRIGDEEHGAHTLEGLPADVVRARARFLAGFRTGLRRSPEVAERSSLESSLAELGRAMAALCLPGGSGAALADVVGGSPLGTTVEVCFEAGEPELLGLPFESLRLPDGRLLATQPEVVVTRRLAGGDLEPREPFAGPLKVLVAVAAPDEESTRAKVLDYERELQNILDATEEAQRRDNVQVRILEVGHPSAMAEALERDAYHVLHVSGHGLPGKLELEDEDGRAVPTTAAELIAPLKATQRPLPLVFLNTCHGGVEAEDTASFAEDLLRAGVPAVVAMQTSVSDHYATLLAHRFYDNLSRREMLLPSRALAGARRDLEAARLKAVEQDAPLAETQPEYATATLFLAGDEAPLADFGLDKEPLQARPVHDMSGPVPQLRRDDLIGRRKVLRETLRTLRDEKRRHAGLVLTGIGGVGKSAVAGRAMRRLAEGGSLVAAHAGPWDLERIAVAVGTVLALETDEELAASGTALTRSDLDERVRLGLLAKLLAECPLVLVLDDFEKNLTVDGGEFEDATVADQFRLLVQQARSGRLLLTCRHPVPGFDDFLRHLAVGPLSAAESRKLLRRLDHLARLEPEDLATVLRALGGHPRMLEFLDGLLRGGEGRLPHVTEKLRKTMKDAGVAAGKATSDLDEGLRQVVLLGARDVLLEELLEVCRQEGIDEPLLQLAVSNLPVSPAGLAHMLADSPGGDEAVTEGALRRLEQLSLVFRFEDGAGWVHRWTAEGLAGLVPDEEHRERANRAGRYRQWRVENESHALDDAWEAVRNHLVGRDFDAATGVALACFEAMQRFQQSLARVALAAEVLAVLPSDHGNYGAVADRQGQALLALGYTGRAVEVYERLHRLLERRAEAHPDRAEYQRDLSVSYNKMGDLYRSLGQGEQAREAYGSSLAIAERLASSEPERADYQRDLSVSYNKMGDLYVSLGQGEQAREAYGNSLAIRERLASSEPDRADYQRDLAASLQRQGDVLAAQGLRGEAKSAYERLLAVSERLAVTEPDRIDIQQPLVVSLLRVADFSDRREQLLQRALSILQRFDNEGRLPAEEQPLLDMVKKLLRS